ncbi:hypothetical protein [Defluviimonas salinarum]|uniref:Uncharacterized protein n=1 Tax=Defluviimonas salinarum TaxID=2992147 RepID=A0ABT3J9S8_9RHOB|nr:hypothetical protein [Defluviimonas salinarum]MCW3784446.1 hypothetical protein [Defluviimonas salinarum]
MTAALREIPEPLLCSSADARGSFRWLVQDASGVIVAHTPLAAYRIHRLDPSSFDFDPEHPYLLRIDHVAWAADRNLPDTFASLFEAQEAASGHFTRLVVTLRYLLGATEELAEALGHEIGLPFADRTDLPLVEETALCP